MKQAATGRHIETAADGQQSVSVESPKSQRGETQVVSDQRKQYLIRKMNQIKLIQYFTKAKKHVPLDLTAVKEGGLLKVSEKGVQKTECSQRSLKSNHKEANAGREVNTKAGHTKSLSSNLEAGEALPSYLPTTRMPSGRRNSDQHQENVLRQTPSTQKAKSHNRLKSFANSDVLGATQYNTALKSKHSTERQLLALNEHYEQLKLKPTRTSRSHTNKSIDSHRMFSKKTPVQMITGVDMPYKRKISVIGGYLRF